MTKQDAREIFSLKFKDNTPIWQKFATLLFAEDLSGFLEKRINEINSCLAFSELLVFRGFENFNECIGQIIKVLGDLSYIEKAGLSASVFFNISSKLKEFFINQSMLIVCHNDSLEPYSLRLINANVALKYLSLELVDKFYSEKLSIERKLDKKRSWFNPNNHSFWPDIFETKDQRQIEEICYYMNIIHYWQKQSLFLKKPIDLFNSNPITGQSNMSNILLLPKLIYPTLDEIVQQVITQFTEIILQTGDILILQNNAYLYMPTQNIKLTYVPI